MIHCSNVENVTSLHIEKIFLHLFFIKHVSNAKEKNKEKDHRKSTPSTTESEVKTQREVEAATTTAAAAAQNSKNKKNFLDLFRRT